MQSAKGTLHGARCTLHLFVALAALALSTPAVAQEQSFTVFFRGTAIGSEQITLARTPEGWTITSSGRVGAPLDIVTRRLEMQYDPEWKPKQLSIDATVQNQPITVRTWVEGTTATTHIARGAQPTDKTETVPADVLILPSPFWAPFTAMSMRLKDASAGETLHAYVPGQLNYNVTVGESTTEQIQTVAGLVVARRTPITLTSATGTMTGEVWGDANGRLVRITLPAESVDVVREDIAAVSSRRVTISRANDEPIKIGSNGVTLVGTLSKPANASGKLPAVVLVGASGPHDRDEILFGVPVLGQIADALANAGFAVLRYDKRGIGQSGGRVESASLTDLAEDVRAAVKVLGDRKDIDAKHIAVIGHAEGGAVALLAASKDKKIAAVGLVATNGVSGSDLVLAQQQHILSKSSLSPAEKQERIDLQKRINDAIVTGKDLDKLPPDVRRQIDNTEFQTLLANDPAKVMPNVKQPILVVQGTLDTQVDPSNADKLEELAKKRKNGGAVEVVKVPAVNHLLVPATTGEADEYATLTDKHVSAAVTRALADWLHKTFANQK
ncbi:MAG TPA: alpha/beta fold hydrolase [Vicinamibacterales bacterium]|nr:alpha/beta fold hydrolase [Vicinamibacterales bacterium]